MKKKAASNDVSDFGGIASSEEEEEEQEEEEEVMYEVPDCEGMTVHDPPLKYIAVKKGAVRIEASLESEKVRTLLVPAVGAAVSCWPARARGARGIVVLLWLV